MTEDENRTVSRIENDSMSDEIIIDAVVLAGGKIEESLREYTDADNKAFIDIAGRPMVEHALRALKGVRRISRVVLCADEEKITVSMRCFVDVTAKPGETLVKTLRSGINSLRPLPDYILAMPSDMPLVTTEAIDDFLDRSLTPPVDITYAYLSKEDSEAKFPEVSHTYVKIKEGTFCGTGFFLMRPGIADDFEKSFEKFASNRKNPLGLAGMLGLGMIVKYLMGGIAVSDAEQKIEELLGGNINARGVQTRYAEAGFNVDAPNELTIARRMLEKK